MFCSVDEAFDNPLQQKINEYNKQNHHNQHKLELENSIQEYQEQNNITPPHMAGIIQYPNVNQSFFTAQGDMSKNGPYFEGTPISQLQDDDSVFDDFSLSDNSLMTDLSSRKPKKLDHDYCTNSFLQSMLNGDAMSLDSQDSAVYDHIKKCKNCRQQINKKMKDYIKTKVSETCESKELVKNQSKDKNEGKLKEFFSENIGYDFKETIIIILAGIVFIFVLDLLVKIGKRL